MRPSGSAPGHLLQSAAWLTFMLQTWFLSSELAQGAICVLLKKEIAARGGADSLRQSQKKTVSMPNPKSGVQRTITFARYNQIRLSDMIEQAVLNIVDFKLNAKLMYLLLLHRKQVEQLETFLT